MSKRHPLLICFVLRFKDRHKSNFFPITSTLHIVQLLSLLRRLGGCVRIFRVFHPCVVPGIIDSVISTPPKHRRTKYSHCSTTDYENRGGPVTVTTVISFSSIRSVPSEVCTYTVRTSPNSQTPKIVCKTDLAAYMKLASEGGIHTFKNSTPTLENMWVIGDVILMLNKPATHRRKPNTPVIILP